MGLRTPERMAERLRNCLLNRAPGRIRREERPFRRCKRVPLEAVEGEVFYPLDRPQPAGQVVTYCKQLCYSKCRWLVNCTCTNGQGPPPAAERPGCGDPYGVCPGGLNSGAWHRDCCPCAFPRASQPSANRGCFRAVPVRSGEGARKSDPVQGGAADSKERRTFRTARMGRKLSGERGVGGAFGFPGQNTREDRARTQNRVALLRKARPSGNDL